MTESAATTAPRYIPATEGAKMIRTQLKITFPGVKFSVRVSHSGGNSTRIEWVDGPTAREVEKVVAGFAGGRFDGMTDSSSRVRSLFCPTHGAGVTDGPDSSPCCDRAELVQFSTTFVFATRTISPEFQAELQAAVAKDYGRPYDPTVMVDGQWMSDFVYRLSVKTSKFVAPSA